MIKQAARSAAVNYVIKNNAFGDQLPVIPADSTVAFGSVLFRLDLQIVLSLDDKPLRNASIPFKVSGQHSHAHLWELTDSDGMSTLRVETRYRGLSTVVPCARGFEDSTFNFTIDEAWYEAPFLITAYNCCHEDDFHGPLTSGKGVGLHKHDFLYGGNGIIMEGSGQACDGRFIQILNPEAMRWNRGYAGIANPNDAIFGYVDAPQGTFAPVIENRSIAIDPAVLPPLHRVQIVGPREVGIRRGDDTGGAIRGFHFDNYIGSGSKSMRSWNAAGSNIEKAAVKYLGP